MRRSTSSRRGATCSRRSSKGRASGEIKALKKPNLAAWAVNQLARKHPDEVEAIFDVTEKLRHAQRRVLSGGKATELRKATDERNKVVGQLKKLGAKILRDAGSTASASSSKRSPTRSWRRIRRRGGRARAQGTAHARARAGSLRRRERSQAGAERSRRRGGTGGRHGSRAVARSSTARVRAPGTGEGSTRRVQGGRPRRREARTRGGGCRA